MVILFKNECSVRLCSVQYLFLYLWPKFLKSTFEVVHTYYRFFSRKIHIHMENLLDGYFYYSSFISNFLNRYFQELLFVAGKRKNSKIYQRKLKLADRLWALEIAYLKLCLCGQLFCIRQTSKFSRFCRVTSWAMCLTDKYLWKTSPNKRRGKSTTPTISNQELFVALVTTINCCHKEIYYRCCRGS